MKIAISGSNGLIASYLIEALRKNNHQVIPIDRTLLLPSNADSLRHTLESCDAVINLAGATINQRWNARNKKLIYDSRIESTRALVLAINSLKQKPNVFISTSAVGAYPIDAISDENDTRYGENFLAQVCKDWETEARNISSKVRLVIPRFGVVLASDGGAFPQMCIPFRLFLGGKIATGLQGLSWIHIDDLVNGLLLTLNNEKVEGIVNFTSPQITDNALFTSALSKIINRPAWLTIPKFILHLILGDQAQLLTEGQKIMPKKLIDLGFHFQYPTLDLAIQKLLSTRK
jgi:uncharacterized protein (TIGR01777 family)